MARKRKGSREKFDSFADYLPEGFRDTWERMPEEMKEYFVKAAEESSSAEEFVSRIMVGSCLRCGSMETVSCDEVHGIEDPTIGMCLQCGYLWCLECEASVTEGQDCSHWDACETCDYPKNEYGDCETLPSECDPMKAWMKSHPLPFHEMACAWCRKRLSNQASHFVLGVKTKSPDQLPKGKATVEIDLPSKKRKAPAIVPGELSKARKSGKDLLFVTCCEKCSDDLSRAIESDAPDLEIVV